MIDPKEHVGLMKDMLIKLIHRNSSYREKMGNIEDHFGVCYHAMCLAAVYYDATKSTWSTYATRVMINRLSTELFYRSRRERDRLTKRRQRGDLEPRLEVAMEPRKIASLSPAYSDPVPEWEEAEPDPIGLWEAIQRLPLRHAEALTRYYGLYGRSQQNFREIGDTMGVSKERARQLVDKARFLLKAMLTKEE